MRDRQGGGEITRCAKDFLEPSINMYRDFACDTELTMRYSVARARERGEEKELH